MTKKFINKRIETANKKFNILPIVQHSIVINNIIELMINDKEFIKFCNKIDNDFGHDLLYYDHQGKYFIEYIIDSIIYNESVSDIRVGQLLHHYIEFNNFDLFDANITINLFAELRQRSDIFLRLMNGVNINEKSQFIENIKTLYKGSILQDIYSNKLINKDIINLLKLDEKRIDVNFTKEIKYRTLANDNLGYSLCEFYSLLAHPCQFCATDKDAWHTRWGFCDHNWQIKLESNIDYIEIVTKLDEIVGLTNTNYTVLGNLKDNNLCIHSNFTYELDSEPSKYLYKKIVNKNEFLNIIKELC